MQILNILYIFLFANLIITCLPVRAQIIPDATLNNNSKVTVIDNADIITGGTVVGGNLFHSFEQFSVPTGKAAYFNNDLSIQNIISRVTGSSISNIDGILQANGTSNFFLINPNGITFGPNASLNIEGSFLASTANSLNFADGSQFNATKSQPMPLLTISVPVGLQFSTNPRPIQVNGYGHSQLIFVAVGSPIYGSGQSSSGLKTSPGKTIALVGEPVTLDGGILTAPSGRVEIGSVASGLVNLSLADTGLFLNYDNIQDFKDIYLNNQALVDASGLINGNISLQGKI
ncbi:filamentous hemagglutinin N-terminal domain-containing protein [Gloeocapsa sp. BRSZ]